MLSLILKVICAGVGRVWERDYRVNVGTQMAGSGLSYNFCDRNITIFMWGLQRESSFIACLHLTLFLVDLKMHPSSVCSSVRAVSVSHCMQGRLFLLRWYTKPPLLRIYQWQIDIINCVT